MGYGIESGKLYSPPNKDIVMDLTDINGRPIAQQADTQSNAIANLKMDWSRFLDEDGNQLQTVGPHFSGSRPLNKDELSKLDRRGVCLSCLKNIPDEDLATSLLSHVAEYADIEIDNEEHANILNKSIRMSAWVQVLGGLFVILLFVVILIKWLKKKKKK